MNTPDPSLTLREERLHVSSQTQASRRVRLSKKIVTEEVTLTVTVQKEVAVVEEESVSVEGVASATGVGDRAAEITLHEQRPLISLEWVPVERVRLVPEVVTEEAVVTETIQREEATIEEETQPK